MPGEVAHRQSLCKTSFAGAEYIFVRNSANLKIIACTLDVAMGKFGLLVAVDTLFEMYFLGLYDEMLQSGAI